ncbi:CHY zinc finger protein [Algoriphagus halophytocola]|uniref:CHY zinc finger protein n=1 Tax=Algoriphagus halophytocola TaxID=2991499 RepID=A0ABY6MLT8_9BACT|nr:MULTISPECIES: CHY zinc finger protein [unclassified Algoriphagus]UZD23347.1 CHY zinc finger protein [Algoriphagus sp. TR-M5]WBL44642.1 CHY zinc finger protein [Algoriphagus sp. TR-M9]
MKLLLKLTITAVFLCISGGIMAQQNAALPIVKSNIKGINIYGKTVDNQTRCQHWHSDLDVIAIKFKCCEKYYPCFSCHEEEADHKPQVWPKSEFDSKAILCGVCGSELTIAEYQASGNTCPNCTAAFNPGCSKHYHLYFETEN